MHAICQLYLLTLAMFKEILSDIDNCYICDRNANSIAHYICRVLQSGRRTNGRQSIEKYSTISIAYKLIEIYMKVIQDSHFKRERKK